MKSPERLAFESVEQLQRQAASDVADLIRSTLRHRDSFSISLSGGSTPKRMYELLAQESLPWDQVHWFWGDERNVPHDHDDSNYKMVKTAWLDQIDAPESNVHPVPVKVSDPQAAAKAYQYEILEHFGDLPPRWDLVLLGMGDDAHTASLFPQTDAIGVDDQTFVANWVPKLDAYRYTLTYPAINSGASVWFVVAGAGKKQAFAQVTHHDIDVRNYPAQLVRPDRWYLTSDVLGE
ncbi:6-phosphogluconolactonase [Crateriforma spongiae]|uniref:6-phosphogluconolactonase n=1 Tax=Crateriforma spongiae TaxID=2724528 RepID=UPI001446E519|nr:6-phosphogluconolactonase [Crateriforma spongiae]